MGRHDAVRIRRSSKGTEVDAGGVRAMVMASRSGKDLLTGCDCMFLYLLSGIKLIILHVGPQEVAFWGRHIQDCPQIVAFLGTQAAEDAARKKSRVAHVADRRNEKRSHDEIVIVLFFLVIGDIDQHRVLRNTQ